MSRKLFVALLIAAIIGLVIAVSMRLGTAGILPFGGINNEPSTTVSSTTGSREQSQPNTTATTTGQTSDARTIAPGTTISQNQTSTHEESLLPILLPSQVNFSTFENPRYLISIQYPSNWQIEDEDNDEDGTVDIAGFLSPFEDRFDTYKERLWLSLDTLPNPKIALGDYSRGVIWHNIGTLQDFRLLDNDTDSIVLAGYPAYRHVNQWRLDDGTIIKQMEIGTKVGDKAYYIDYYAEEENFNRYLPVIQEMINSFRIGL